MIRPAPGQYRLAATGDVWRVVSVDDGTAVLRRDAAAWALCARRVARMPLVTRGGEPVETVTSGSGGQPQEWCV